MPAYRFDAVRGSMRAEPDISRGVHPPLDPPEEGDVDQGGDPGGDDCMDDFTTTVELD